MPKLVKSQGAILVPREMCVHNSVKGYEVIIQEWKWTSSNQEVIDKRG